MDNNFLLRCFNKNYYLAYKEAFSYQEMNRSELQKVITRKLQMLLQHAKHNVPYYVRYKLNNELKSLNDFPIVDKNMISNDKDSFLATGLATSRRKYNSTSGSTGESFYFYSDNETDIRRDAFAHLGESWAGALLREPKLIIWGSERDVIKSFNLKRKVAQSKYFLNYRILSSYHMTNDDIMRFLNDVYEKYTPSILIGYPSTLESISRYILKSKIDVHHNVKGIITSGEMLLDYQREIIESIFNTKVYNRYGCREVGPISHECSIHDGMHIFAPHVFVEVLSSNGTAAQEGELGEIVVTDLDNYVFPFIRYKIGDLGIASNKVCECGCPFPILQKVEGRVFDVIIGMNGNRVPGNFFTLLRNKVIGVAKFQVIQKKANLLIVRVVPESGFTLDQEEKIKVLIQQKVGAEMNIEIQMVDDIPTMGNGKYRFIISEVSSD